LEKLPVSASRAEPFDPNDIPAEVLAIKSAWMSR
jgi:hypothetical protein